MSYKLAGSLVQLRAQVNERWPGRDKKSDGWIGDASHNARKSDHNPDYSAGGVVRALDIDKDGIIVAELLAAVVGEPRVAYVIWNRRIWTHAKGWQPYSGSNPHTGHVHISIRHTKAAESGSAWALGASVTPQKKPSTPAPQKPAPKPVKAKQWPDKALLEDGDFGKVTVKALQEVLKGVKLYSGLIDGDFGKLTKIALQKWLKHLGHYNGLIDGNFGPLTVKALQSFLVKKGELPNKAYIDGGWGKVTKKAFQGYINSQTKHYK